MPCLWESFSWFLQELASPCLILINLMDIQGSSLLWRGVPKSIGKLLHGMSQLGKCTKSGSWDRHHFCWRSPRARLADIATKDDKDSWQQHCATSHMLLSLALVTLSISPSKSQNCLEGFWLKVWCGARESVFLTSCWVLFYF